MASKAFPSTRFHEAVEVALRTDESVFVRINKRDYVGMMIALGDVHSDTLDVSVDMNTKLIELTRKEA